MKTVQMTLDDDLVKAVDRVAKRLHTTRSGFARKALRDALGKFSMAQLERRHRRGYEAQPVSGGEFDVWESEQSWGDEWSEAKSAGTHSLVLTRSVLSWCWHAILSSATWMRWLSLL
jgi:predicted transcriptional regulator